MKQISKDAINNLGQYSENIHVFRRDDKSMLEIREEEVAWEAAAKSSFNIAKLCLEVEEIPNSIFNLQQTIEKITKTLLYSCSLYDNPRKGQHKPHLLYEELYLEEYVDERDEYGYEMCLRCKNEAITHTSFVLRIHAFEEILSDIKKQTEEYQCMNMSLANTFYYQYATMALCFLFQDTEQNARYPEKAENSKLVTPTDLYPKCLKKPLQSIVHIIERIFMCMDSPLHL